MTQQQSVYPVPAQAKARTWLTNEAYLAMYQQSITEPETFWAEHGKRLNWFKSFTKVKDTSFELGNVHVNWFSDGTLTPATTA